MVNTSDEDWSDFFGTKGKNQEIGNDGLQKARAYQEISADMVAQYRDILQEKGFEGSTLKAMLVLYQSFLFQYTIQKSLFNNVS